MMLYISKGIPEKAGATDHLRVISGGRLYTLFAADEDLWLRGRFGFAETQSYVEERTVHTLLRMGLVEYSSNADPAGRYAILTRCLLVPAKPGSRSGLKSEEKFVLKWLQGTSLRLSLAELICLYENRVMPSEQYFGEENRQALYDCIYGDGHTDDQILEVEMAKSPKRDVIVNAVVGLLKKKRLVLL